ncbi:EamA family transporter RarD [soil metagenome]
MTGRPHPVTSIRNGAGNLAAVSEERRGFFYGLAAFSIWGIFPLYWPLLDPAGAVEVLAHRIVWSLVVVVALVAVLRLRERLLAVVRDRRRLGLLALAAAIISVNWVTYIWGVTHGFVIETALGYFINPLVLVLMGVFLLGERLRSWQWCALALAAAGVLVLTVDYGRPPVIALILASSFGTYGLLKKRAAVGAVEGLVVETGLLAPVALGYLLLLGALGTGTFSGGGGSHAALLAGTGVITALPLLLFGAAAPRVRLTTIALLQYVAPLLQFLLGLVVFGEPMTTPRWFGFGLVWIALVVISVEATITAQRSIRAARLDPVATAADSLT